MQRTSYHVQVRYLNIPSAHEAHKGLAAFSLLPVTNTDSCNDPARAMPP